jgi:hypothetical protein
MHVSATHACEMQACEDTLLGHSNWGLRALAGSLTLSIISLRQTWTRSWKSWSRFRTALGWFCLIDTPAVSTLVVPASSRLTVTGTGRCGLQSEMTRLDYEITKRLANRFLLCHPHPDLGHFIQLDDVNCEAAAEIVYTFIRVLCEIPVRLNKYLYNRKSGFGLIIDVKKRLIIVSRAVVLYNLCDITVIIATSILVERKIVFLHPITNFTII